MNEALLGSDEDVGRHFSIPGAVTKLITSEELKEKLDRGDDFKLVMAFADWHFRAVHIPGSISVGSPAEAGELLDPEDEIVVYCTNVARSSTRCPRPSSSSSSGDGCTIPFDPTAPAVGVPRPQRRSHLRPGSSGCLSSRGRRWL